MFLLFVPFGLSCSCLVGRVGRWVRGLSVPCRGLASGSFCSTPGGVHGVGVFSRRRRPATRAWPSLRPPSGLCHTSRARRRRPRGDTSRRRASSETVSAAAGFWGLSVLLVRAARRVPGLVCRCSACVYFLFASFGLPCSRLWAAFVGGAWPGRSVSAVPCSVRSVRPLAVFMA